MTAAALRLYRQASFPQRLGVLAAAAYAAVFAALVATRPGIGVGQGFYVPIVLASMAGTVATGIGAGLLAALLYELGAVGAAGAGAELSSLRGAIHLVTYVAAGAIVGYFSTRARLMLRDALHALDDLLRLARRDLDTGARDARGLEASLATWLATAAPFGLLVGELDCGGGGAGLRRATRLLRASTGPSAEVARVGPSQFAVVTWVRGLGEAHAAALALESVLDEHGCKATFGWAVSPSEGRDGLSLFRAASERLYARRVVRGEWTPSPAATGLVDEPIEPA